VKNTELARVDQKWQIWKVTDRKNNSMNRQMAEQSQIAVVHFKYSTSTFLTSDRADHHEHIQIYVWRLLNWYYWQARGS